MSRCRANCRHVSTNCVRVQCHATYQEKTKPIDDRLTNIVAFARTETYRMMLNRRSNVFHIWIVTRIVLIAISCRIGGCASNGRLIPCPWVKTHGCRCNRIRIDGRWWPKEIATTADAIREYRYRLLKQQSVNQWKQTNKSWTSLCYVLTLDVELAVKKLFAADNFHWLGDSRSIEVAVVVGEIGEELVLRGKFRGYYFQTF